ncbi:DNA-binding LacI/PurR family transcriptional regulator [Microbacterium resistens]|uniref:DNA-binding LacI/PurR family transcriptional regulator n=1 Tax=Microbacterium resistens TaxID=156977 RepID=A0ABU1SAV4_9MICO|nr:LacI family DNA-binding transcriptional regulator [Microbacterium resistens]MDR6866741.1 DNA-binding LacI/PurR family transcriptional regulator [Microbacterium resistens]
MTTIADVAARAGVSKATASRALSGSGYVSAETRARVERAAQDLAYVAHSSATNLATGRTQTVGVIMPSVDRWYFAELLSGLQRALVEARLDLVLYNAAEGSADRERMLDHALARRRVDGIIAVCVQPGAHELERLEAARLPLVTVGPFYERSSAISIDDVAAARVATEHLIDLGHEDIAFLGGIPDPDRFGIGDKRRSEGYRVSMTAAGLVERIRTIPASSTIPDAFAAAVDLLADRRHRPTAIVAVCDEAAIGAIIAARRLGIGMPAELSVVGIDDHRYAEMFALTTIRQSPVSQGQEAVRLLRSRMADPGGAAEHVIAPSSLVVRSSTAAPRQV